MALLESSGFSHVRLTVTDIAASKAFYDDVFGWTVAMDNSSRIDEPGITESAADFYGGTIYLTPTGTLFGLRPVAPSGVRFEPDITGLDHLSFAVASRDVLVAAHDAFHDKGVTHGEVVDLAGAGIAILSFEDPDGIQLELTAPLG